MATIEKENNLPELKPAPTKKRTRKRIKSRLKVNPKYAIAKPEKDNVDRRHDNPGPPSSYDPKFCETIVEVARKGGNDAAMALACGLRSRRSLWAWRQKYPEFQQAYEYAKLVTLERNEAILDAYALGKVPKGNFRALEAMLRNADPEKYGAFQAQHVNATQINIHGDYKKIEGMNIGELDHHIAAAMKRLGSIVDMEQSQEEDEEREENDFTTSTE